VKNNNLQQELPQVVPSADCKRIVPARPRPGNEFIHHLHLGAMTSLKRGHFDHAESLLQLILGTPTRDRWIYHSVAAFHLAQLKGRNGVPDLDLLRQCLELNPTFPDALRHCVKQFPEVAERVVRTATGMADLDVEQFAAVVGAGVWKDLARYRDGDAMFHGATLLDVGARHGFNGLVFLAWGGRFYAAVDTAAKAFRLRHVKDHMRRDHPHIDVGFSMEEMAERYPDRLWLSVVEEKDRIPGRFDFITLFSVTEHLRHPAKTLRSLRRNLRSSGRLFASHHNFYCWNGHHGRPKSTAQLAEMESAGEDISLADWTFFKRELPEALNRLRPVELRRVIERYFRVDQWEVQFTPLGKGLERISGEILQRVKPTSAEELLIQRVFISLRRKPRLW
jgi:SAM-dependent methyltransferase